MEMCIDNPREGFADLFATHPSVESRVAALVQYAGGHDPGPLALPEPDEQPGAEQAPSGPWGGDAPEQKPFLPSEPPVSLGEPSPPSQSPGQPPSDSSGPWGPHRG
jgi:heat shock protein HtpX